MGGYICGIAFPRGRSISIVVGSGVCFRGCRRSRPILRRSVNG
jgi:hypothetical protein